MNLRWTQFAIERFDELLDIHLIHNAEEAAQHVAEVWPDQLDDRLVVKQLAQGNGGVDSDDDVLVMQVVDDALAGSHEMPVVGEFEASKVTVDLAGTGLQHGIIARKAWEGELF